MPVTLKRRVARQVLRVLLIRARTAKGASQLDAARAAGLKNQPNYAAYESGASTPDEDKLAKLLAYFGMEDRLPILLKILGIARSSSRKPEKELGLFSDVEVYMLLEWFAESITIFEMTGINGLFQTEDHARATFEYAAQLYPGLDVEHALALRMERQLVFERDEPLPVTMYIHEFALRRPIGTDEVRVAQWRHLLDLTKKGAALRVIPMHTANLPTTRPMVFMRFTTKWCMAYAENGFEAKIYDDHNHIERAGTVIGLLHQTALSPAKSAELVTDLIEELTAA